MMCRHAQSQLGGDVHSRAIATDTVVCTLRIAMVHSFAVHNDFDLTWTS